MLLALAQWLQNDYGFLRVFNYLTFRAVMASLTALVIGLGFGPWVIRRLTEMKVGQAVRSYGPPVAEGEKRRTPLLISAAAHQGVTEALRGLVRVIDDAKAADGDLKPASTWQP